MRLARPGDPASLAGGARPVRLRASEEGSERGTAEPRRALWASRGDGSAAPLSEPSSLAKTGGLPRAKTPWAGSRGRGRDSCDELGVMSWRERERKLSADIRDRANGSDDSCF